jgi:hypothetical protein
LKYEELLIGNDYHDINPNEWKKIKSNDDFPDGVSSIFYKIDNKTRPKVKLRLSGDFDVNQILSNPLTQPKQRDIHWDLYHDNHYQ